MDAVIAKPRDFVSVFTPKDGHHGATGWSFGPLRNLHRCRVSARTATAFGEKTAVRAITPRQLSCAYENPLAFADGDVHCFEIKFEICGVKLKIVIACWCFARLGAQHDHSRRKALGKRRDLRLEGQACYAGECSGSLALSTGCLRLGWATANTG